MLFFTLRRQQNEHLSLYWRNSLKTMSAIALHDFFLFSEKIIDIEFHCKKLATIRLTFAVKIKHKR